MAKQKLTVEGLQITIDKKGYISLTDIARQSDRDRPAELIRRWLRNTSTITYLGTWEQVHNPNFKVAQMSHFREYAAVNRNTISVKIYLEQTEAIGITSKSGRYGGTFSHSDIALNFCYWLSPEFQVYFLKEFQRLKNDEAVRLGLTFDLRREITKTNYSLQTEAIKTNLLTNKIKTTKNDSNVYASEADLLNIIVFACTAKQWKQRNPKKKGNLRDHASIEELLLLLNMESLNATMINWEYDQEMRAEVLKVEANRQRPIIAKDKAVKRLKDQNQKKLKG